MSLPFVCAVIRRLHYGEKKMENRKETIRTTSGFLLFGPLMVLMDSEVAENVS